MLEYFGFYDTTVARETEPREAEPAVVPASRAVDVPARRTRSQQRDTQPVEPGLFREELGPWI